MADLRRAVRALGLVCVLMVLISACSDGPESGPGEGTSSAPPRRVPVPVTPQPRTTPTDCPVGQSRGADGTCAPCPDYEGCFTRSSDMEFFLNKIIGLISGYSKATYKSMPEPAHWYFVPIGVTGTMKCVQPSGAPATYSDRSYEYCPSDKNIYIGESRMWAFYSDLGDAAAAVGIAHEWGHHVQQVVGVKTPSGASDELRRQHTIKAENQADCIAGAWFGYEVKQGVANDDDIKDADAIIAAIASAEGPTRNHGTLDERSRAFIKGFRDGIAACSYFFPDRPLLT